MPKDNTKMVASATIKPRTDLDEAQAGLLAVRDSHLLIAIDPAKPKSPPQAREVDVSNDSEWEMTGIWIKAQQGRKRNIYFHANPVKDGLTRKAAKADMLPCDMLQADLDPEGSGTFAANRKALQARVKAMREGPNAPTVLIDSGNGYNALWRLKTPLPVADYELANKTFNEGLGVKGTHNADRILKVPGTRAWPNAAKLKRGYPAFGQAALVAVTTTVMGDEAVAGLGGAPVAKPVSVDSTTKDRFAAGDDPEGLAEKMADLRRSSARIDAAFGDSGGDRSATLQVLAAAMKARGWSPEEFVAAIMGHTIDASGHVLDQADPERTLERSWDRTTAEARMAAKDEFPVVKMPGGITMPRHLLQSWCYLLADDAFFRMETGEKLTRTVFNIAMKKHTPTVTVTNAAGALVQRKLSAAETLLDHLGGKAVSCPVYMPSAGDMFFSLNGVDHVNLYRPNSVPTAAPNWKAHAAWRVVWAHYTTMLGTAQATELFMWLAFCAQNPGVKIRHAILLCGVQGDGKSTLEKIMVQVMGIKNVSKVSPEEIRSNFTGWMAGKALSVIEEIRFHGTSRHDALDRMKPAITNDRLVVVHKNAGGREIPNVTNYLAFTNHADALALSAGDRRWAVLRSVFDTRAQMLAVFDAAHFDELHQMIENHPEVLRGWLLAWDLSGFDPNKAPQISAHKRAMMEAAQGQDQTAVVEAVALGGQGIGPDVLTTGNLSASIKKREGTSLGTRRLSQALDAEGWIKPKADRFSWGGEMCRIYVRKDANLADATRAALKVMLNATLFDAAPNSDEPDEN